MRLLGILLGAVMAIGCLMGCGEATTTSAQPSPEPSSVAHVPGVNQEDYAPGDSYGVVIGELVLTDGRPAAGIMLYLADCLGCDASNPAVVLDISKHSSAKTDETGRFVFDHVAPGLYALVVWEGAQSAVVEDSSTGSGFVVDVVAGKVADRGRIVTPLP